MTVQWGCGVMSEHVCADVQLVFVSLAGMCVDKGVCVAEEVSQAGAARL